MFKRDSIKFFLLGFSLIPFILFFAVIVFLIRFILLQLCYFTLAACLLYVLYDYLKGLGDSDARP